MSDYYDSSGLIRAFRMGKSPEGVTRSHALAEFYCIVTGTGITEIRGGQPVRVTAPPKAAAARAATAFARMKFVDMGAPEVFTALAAAAEKNVTGKLIHDWLHVTAAEAAECERIVTLNRKDFERMTQLPLVEEAD